MRRLARRLRVGARLAGLAILVATAIPEPAVGDTWRLGDRDQPWNLFPVSFRLDAGEVFRSEHIWGGPRAVEIVVDDDGDGRIDEDPVEVVDDDGDGLFNEDPVDGIDSDRDGRVDEDGVDPQFDNDGDGLLNEDGLRTGGVVYNPVLRREMEAPPFERYPTAQAAAGDPEGHGTAWGDGGGYGWGDDDRDVNFNEDDLDGRDNDGDGLVDEDPPGPGIPVPGSWEKIVFAYEAEGYSPAERRAIAFSWDGSAYVAVGPDRVKIIASAESRRLSPSDWLRPIRLDATRNATVLAVDRYYSGEFANDPTNSANWNAGLGGSSHADVSGHGVVADGDIFTARTAVGRAFWGGGYHVNFNALFHLDLIRLRPRPDFPERTPTTFDIWYAGDLASHFRTSSIGGTVMTQMDVRDPIVPRQTDQLRPSTKEYRFGGGGEFGAVRARVLQFESWMTSQESWELAEFQTFGHGYALDAAYVSEVIDVGSVTPRFRRYFDPEEAGRTIAAETIQTFDANKNGSIEVGEQARTVLAEQFDPDAPGDPVTWGRVRWHGQVEGDDATLQVRVRSGSTLDTRIYQRRVGQGVLSPFVATSIVEDWPEPGSRFDVTAYLQLSQLQRPPVRELPLNLETDGDGIAGGWTPWSPPIDFAAGLVESDASSGGVMLPLPPLHRYIQFRFDFISGENSGVTLDFLEFDFAEPAVSRGVFAEIFPATAAELGRPETFRYVLKPDLSASDAGFDRIDIAVPSAQADVDSLLVDDLRWERVLPLPPSGLSEADGDAWVRERLSSVIWLDTTAIAQAGRFAAATYFDSASGNHKLGIKTRTLTADDFPRGQDRAIEVALTASVFRLLTSFDSWIWNQADPGELLQPTSPGNASDQLPSDAVRVTVGAASQSLTIRKVFPNPFTPNGDGVNDVITWTVDLFMLTEDADVTVAIYDLGGRDVRRLEASAVAGQLDVSWDGRDAAGEIAVPGVYVYQLEVDSDAGGDNEIFGTVALAY